MAVDNCMSLILWARQFMTAQMYPVRWNIIYQDNASSVLLEKNGMQLGFITNCVSKGECESVWVPRNQMIADYLTKALQGHELCEFQDLIMGRV